jgi:hypothetical protein
LHNADWFYVVCAGERAAEGTVTGSGMATAACTASAGFLCTDKHATKQFSDHRFPQYDVPLC